MASTTYHVIPIQTANQMGDVTRQEALAAAQTAITPGQLLEWASATTVQEHATGAGACIPKLIALRSQTPDDEDAFSIDVDYAAADRVYMAVAKPGDQYYMFLAIGENAAANAILQSDGNGDLQVLAAVVDATLATSVVGRTVVAVNNAAGAAAARIIVEII